MTWTLDVFKVVEFSFPDEAVPAPPALADGRQ
jgi:hypothetical protein